VTGFVPCFFSHGIICLISNIVPEGVHTGCSKGCKESAQWVNGRRLKAFLDLRATIPPAPPC
jgi:hypothetical protein